MTKLSDTRFIILDTETTGNDVLVDKPIEIAAVEWINGKPSIPLSEHVWTDVPIKPSACAVHHLTAKNIEGAADYNTVLQQFINYIGSDPMVIHNAPFDLAMLPYFKKNNHPVVCSLRLARHVWMKGEVNSKGFPLANHQAQTLRYWLDLDVNTKGLAAHRAAADILVTGAIFQKAVDRYLELGHPDDVDHFIKFVASPIQYQVVPYGTYAGQQFSKVPDSYINWYLDPNKNSNPDQDLLQIIRREQLTRIQDQHKIRATLPSNIVKANSF